VKPLFSALVILAAAHGVCIAADTAHHVDGLSCREGPYSLQLPEHFAELRKIGNLQTERVLPAPARGVRAEYRELVFNGLRLVVVRPPLDPETYEIATAEIRGKAWKVAGPLRVGGMLPAKLGDVDTRDLSNGSAYTEFNGERDTMRVRRTGRRIYGITYLCVVD